MWYSLVKSLAKIYMSNNGSSTSLVLLTSFLSSRIVEHIEKVVIILILKILYNEHLTLTI